MQTTISQRRPLWTVCKQWPDFANFTHYYVTDNPSFSSLNQHMLLHHAFTLLLSYIYVYIFFFKLKTTQLSRLVALFCGVLSFFLFPPFPSFVFLFFHRPDVFPYSNVIHKNVFLCSVIAFYGFNFLLLCLLVRIFKFHFLLFRNLVFSRCV